MKIHLGALLFALSSACAATPLSPTTKSEIAHLFSYLEKSGCQFSRNGSWYSAGDAVSHLNKKYQYLLDKNLIATAEDFISKGATESSMSGKPYLVKCGDSAAVESAVWFKRELAAFRKQK